MNKAELVERLSRKTRLTKSQVEDVLNEAMATIKSSVRKGQDVTLSGFGTFTKQERKARNGRDPRSGKEISIPSCHVPRFRPGKGFRELMNGKGTR